LDLRIERGRGDAEVASVLADRGYGPYRDRGPAAAQLPVRAAGPGPPDLVCQADLAFMEGLLDGLGRAGLRAVLEPRPGRCCVAFV
jgi:hypothetical protein